MNLKKPFLALSVLTLISACGDDKANSAPEINRWSLSTEFISGAQLNQALLYTLTPDVFDSEGDELTYEWRLLTETDKVTLTNTSLSTLNFTYPLSVSEEVYDLAFEVTVTDENGAFTSDTIEHDFNDYVYIDLPTEMTAQAGQEVTISPRVFGRPSYISHYQWQVTSDHDITLIGSDSKQVSFVAPDSQTPVSLTLTATHNYGYGQVLVLNITTTQ